MHGGLSEGIGMRTYVQGSMDFAKPLTLRFRVRYLDLPEIRKRYISTCGREKEKVDAEICPYGKAIYSRTHIVVESEMHKEERGVLKEEMMEIDESYMEEFGTLDYSEKTMAFAYDGGHRRRNRNGTILAKTFYVMFENNVMNAELLKVCLLGVGTVLRPQRDV